MNGSPLGILDIAPSSSAATTSETSDGGGAEGDWELVNQSAGMRPLAPASSVSQTQNQSQTQHAWSPAKQAAGGGGRTGSLARKPTASSSFKAAILSSTAKFAPSSRNASPGKLFGHAQPHHASGGAGSGFTMTVPGPNPTKARVDWENWAGSFMRELDGMNLKGDDKQKLEERLREVLASQSR